MLIEADSWDDKGGITAVGCKRFSLEAETQEEAMQLAIFVVEFRRTYMTPDKIISGTEENVDGTVKQY